MNTITITAQQSEMDGSIIRGGYTPVSSFSNGFTLTLPDQALRLDSTGEYFVWRGVYPKVVPPGSIPESTGGFSDNSWVDVSFLTLKTQLVMSGSSLVSLSEGGVLKDSAKDITPFMFGAKGDYNPVNNTGTDDTSAFRQAIAAAVALGGRRVRVPAGFNYLITDSLNLGGVGYTGPKGVALVGENWVNTCLYFRAPNNDAACIEILGGSGIHTARYIDGISIIPTRDKLYTGVGYRIAGGCFIKNGSFLVMKFAINVHLLNNIGAGVFTEFNDFKESRVHFGLINILMEANGGDNSFHGNDFWGVQNQVKSSVDIGDGNTVAGVGLELRGVTTTVYWYNGFCYMHMFGGVGSVAVKLTKANTDNIIGCMTGERDLILKSTDASSFEMRGGFYSIGSITFDIANEPATRASTFVFDNQTSNKATFTSPKISALTPRQMPWSLADRTNNGCYPAIFRGTANNIDALCYASLGSTGSHHYFGYVPSGGNLQSFVPGIRINYDGSAITSYGSTFYINNESTGVQLSSSFFAPQSNKVISCGTNLLRFTEYWGVNSAITTSDARHKNKPRDILNAEISAFYTIGKMPSVWQWLDKYKVEGDAARLHSGPTVQSAISVMEAHGLDWNKYSAFCYDELNVDTQNLNGHMNDSGESGIYSFRKSELLLWISRAIIAKHDDLESRLAAIESKIKSNI